MSTGTQTKTGKDVMLLAPDELVLDRDWNGRWTKVSDDAPAIDVSAGGKNALPGDTQQQVSIRELAQSIEDNGQLEDVLVCKRPASDDPTGAGRIYHVVAGQSRTRAVAFLATNDPQGDHKVRCRLLPGNVDNKQAFLINVEENKKRNNLTLLDKAYCMKRERDLGLTVDEVATRWGCSVPAVAQALSLIELPEEIKEAVYDKVITATSAITDLKGLTPESQIEVVQLAREQRAKGAPFKPGQIKELARQRAPQPTPTPEAAPASTATVAPSAEPGATGGNGTAPVAPKKRGRPAGPVKRFPKTLADLRKFLQGREGALSQALVRYLDGYPDLDDAKLGELFDAFEFGDDADRIKLTPRTEGNEPRPDPDAAAFEEEDEPAHADAQA